MTSRADRELLERLVAARRITPAQASWCLQQQVASGADLPRILVQARLVAPGELTPSRAGELASTVGSGGPAPRARPAAADVGPSVGRYQLQAELGRGGMGVVYRALDPAIGREVALKMILSPAAGGQELERFRREAAAAGRIRHPGIVAVYDVGEHQGRPYIAMEFVDGQSLAVRLRAGPLEPAELAAIVRDLALALDQAHRAGVCHRDIKPANVLLDREGRPHLTDFGIARLERAEGLTADGQLIGTLEYMSPEQAGGETARHGPHSDIYALGGVLYHGLAGQPPHRGVGTAALLKAALLEEPARPSSVAAAPPPPALERLAMRCLAKEPTERPTAMEVAAELDRFLTRPATGVPRRAPRALAVAALLVVGGGVAWAAGGGFGPASGAAALAPPLETRPEPPSPPGPAPAPAQPAVAGPVEPVATPAAGLRDGARLELSSRADALVSLPDGSLLAGLFGHGIDVFGPDGALRRTVPVLPGGDIVTALVCAADGAAVYSSDYQRLACWDPVTWEPRWEVPNPDGLQAWNLVPTRHGLVATYFRLDSRTGTGPARIVAYRLHPDGARVAWDLPGAGLAGAAASPDGARILLWFGTDVGVHDAATGARLATLPPPAAPSPLLAFLDDDTVIACQDAARRRFELRRAADGQPLAGGFETSGAIKCLAVTPAGRVVTGDEAGRVALWDPRSGACLLERTPHQGIVTQLHCVPGTSLVASSAAREEPHVVHLTSLTPAR